MLEGDFRPRKRRASQHSVFTGLESLTEPFSEISMLALHRVSCRGVCCTTGKSTTLSLKSAVGTGICCTLAVRTRVQGPSPSLFSELLGSCNRPCNDNDHSSSHLSIRKGLTVVQRCGTGPWASSAVVHRLHSDWLDVFRKRSTPHGDHVVINALRTGPGEHCWQTFVIRSTTSLNVDVPCTGTSISIQNCCSDTRVRVRPGNLSS